MASHMKGHGQIHELLCSGKTLMLHELSTAGFTASCSATVGLCASVTALCYRYRHSMYGGEKDRSLPKLLSFPQNRLFTKSALKTDLCFHFLHKFSYNGLEQKKREEMH